MAPFCVPEAQPEPSQLGTNTGDAWVGLCPPPLLFGAGLEGWGGELLLEGRRKPV